MKLNLQPDIMCAGSQIVCDSLLSPYEAAATYRFARKPVEQVSKTWIKLFVYSSSRMLRSFDAA